MIVNEEEKVKLEHSKTLSIHAHHLFHLKRLRLTSHVRLRCGVATCFVNETCAWRSQRFQVDDGITFK